MLISDELLAHLQMLTACLRQRATNVRIVVKSACYLRDVRPAVRLKFARLPARISAALTGRISVKFSFRDFCDSVSRNPKFGLNWGDKKSDILREGLITFYCYRRHIFAIKSLSCNTQNFIVVDIDM